MSFSSPARQYVSLPSSGIIHGTSRSVDLWFRTTSFGPLWVTAQHPFGSVSSYVMSHLWIGNDGYLRGHFSGSASIITKSLSQVNDGNWHHAVLAGTEPTQTLYIDGQKQVTISPPGSTFTTYLYSQLGAGFGNQSWQVDGGGSNNYFYTGSIDEAAVYTRELTPFEVASHYSAGKGYCSTPVVFGAGLWQQVAGVYDGLKNSTLYVNGRPICKIPVDSGFESPSSILVAGAGATGSNGWSGSMAELTVTRPSSDSNSQLSRITSNFFGTADRFRETPVGNIVTDGLAVHLDAANSKEGMRFPQTSPSPASPCSETSWHDLTSNAYDGELINLRVAVALNAIPIPV